MPILAVTGNTALIDGGGKEGAAGVGIGGGGIGIGADGGGTCTGGAGVAETGPAACGALPPPPHPLKAANKVTVKRL
jgi:hypothetical protein